MENITTTLNELDNEKVNVLIKRAAEYILSLDNTNKEYFDAEDIERDIAVNLEFDEDQIEEILNNVDYYYDNGKDILDLLKREEILTANEIANCIAVYEK